MTEQKSPRKKKRVLESDAENERRARTGTQVRGNLPYTSGRNRGMQAQRSNRQGSGKPTDQRLEDR